jgi:hypothetical protein
MGRLVLSGAVGAASRREVWGDGEMREMREMRETRETREMGQGAGENNQSPVNSQQSSVISQQSTVISQHSPTSNRIIDFLKFPLWRIEG